MRYAIGVIAIMGLCVSIGMGFRAAPANAQASVKGPPTQQQESPEQAESRRREARERENAYKNAMKNIPEQKANKDPWAGAR